MKHRKIVDSMSIEEIIELYRQETPFVGHKLEELHKFYFRQLYDSHKEITFFKPAEFKRNSGFNLVFQYVDKGTAYPKKNRLANFYYFWFLYRGGIHAIRFLLPKESCPIIYLYTPHFIDRYRERALNGLTITKPEALNIFIRNNYKPIYKNIPNDKYKENGWMCYNEGLVHNHVKFSSFCLITMKTFISWKCITEKRKDISKSIFQDAISNGWNVSVPDSLLEEFNDIID